MKTWLGSWEIWPTRQRLDQVGSKLSERAAVSDRNEELLACFGNNLAWFPVNLAWLCEDLAWKISPVIRISSRPARFYLLLWSLDFLRAEFGEIFKKCRDSTTDLFCPSGYSSFLFPLIVSRRSEKSLRKKSKRVASPSVVPISRAKAVASDLMVLRRRSSPEALPSQMEQIKFRTQRIPGSGTSGSRIFRLLSILAREYNNGTQAKSAHLPRIHWALPSHPGAIVRL